MNTSKGFTIIELLVVISIIGVLASIVIFNNTGAINKSKNSVIKINLTTVPNVATSFYDSRGDYNGFCASTDYSRISDKTATAYGTGNLQSCNVRSDNTAWCACSNLKTTDIEPAGSTFCVDSTGNAKVTTTDCATECVTASGSCI